MDIGITGTRDKLTTLQKKSLAIILFQYTVRSGTDNLTIHHGCCLGTDQYAHELAVNNRVKIHGYPGTDNYGKAPYRMPIKSSEFTVWNDPKQYRERNIDIIGNSDILVACPSLLEGNSPRSGTWMTIRIARKKGVPILLIWPSGSVTMEGEIAGAY